ncbi:hypothetical protein K493DRAFT_408813 [Basidiobolus meristosporus CBS 931.73]|uniref:YncI copper-binding domain-containing protein n=1 Tax=Basidiobolus meristosporus CBS 931.73 TaxID=1314790 RepID=A0A1Y1Y4H6_9FUNG|nr:hypothetical protein K493DRAFT_408813 [Basidiobolus meristosporus CBS 931.73]|eukprot:ORX92504.1 hypothetical protein K493DRAFT_408813 [Basidiobolus meristosporus CBS 931.73]
MSHVTANPNAAYLDSYFQTSFRVGHGCSNSPTVKLTIDIPDGVTSVAPHQLYNWTIAINYRPLVPPVTSHGETINQTVSSVTYTGYLEPTYYEDFGVSMKLPAQVTNNVLYFPVHQICVNGSTEWTDIPQPGKTGQLASPAASVQTVPKPATDGKGTTSAATSMTSARSLLILALTAVSAMAL